MGEARLTLRILGALTLFYAVLGLWALVPEAVYSGDIGVKYVQARALAAAHFGSLDIPYPGAFLDPAGDFRPMRPPFVMATGGTVQAIFSPLSAMLQAVVIFAGGLRGLVLLSIAGAVGTLAAAASLAQPTRQVPLLLMLGLASPLWFYAVSGWEHAPAVACGTLGFLVAWRARTLREACAAGCLVGCGAVLRDEVVLLMPGILAILVWRCRRAAPLAAALGGVLIPLALAAGVEVGWFHRPAAAHVRHAVHLVQRAAHLTGAPNPDVPALAPFTLRDRYATVVQYWLLGYGNDRLIALFAAALVAALALRRTMGSSLALFAWLLMMAALAALDLREVIAAPKWLAGLLRVSPWLTFALLPLPAKEEPAPGHDPVLLQGLRRAILATGAAYLALAFAGVDTTGGKALGPRLLLPLLPLLAVSAVATIGTYLAARDPWDRRIGTVGVALAGMALAIHLGGCLPAYYARNREDAKGIRAVAQSGERVIVADDEFTAQLLLPLYYRRILLLASAPDEWHPLGARLAAARVSSLLVATRWSDTPIDLAPFNKRRTERHGRLTIQFWER